MREKREAYFTLHHENKKGRNLMTVYTRVIISSACEWCTSKQDFLQAFSCIKASQYWFVPCMGEENKQDASVKDRLMLCRLMTKPHGNSQLQALCGRELKKQENGRKCLLWVCDVLEKLPSGSGRKHRWRRDQWNQWKTKTGRGKNASTFWHSSGFKKQ